MVSHWVLLQTAANGNHTITGARSNHGGIRNATTLPSNGIVVSAPQTTRLGGQQPNITKEPFNRHVAAQSLK